MPQQVKILAVVFIVALASLTVVRYVSVPDTFGDLGHYRAAAVDSEAALPIHYAGERACLDCHDDVYEDKTQAKHASLACETCHGPAAIHVEDEDSLPHVPREREHCALCHAFQPARPNGFPQVELAIHNPRDACIDCHDPHAPLPDLSEADCNACHGEIARTKAVSHHAELACERCHTVPEAHRDTPRQVRPTKPSSIQLCGECHDRSSSESAAIPRISLTEHEPEYVCWQCHYPHFPEAR
ncbi:MAG: hypothetical protein HN712_13190 [Gemmatimonadetes bacterium]|nr:hypothetical protein [Gemmatimonadota bacterium]MBT7861269.1 hypothetical protein [Gemmatimonadota bacterium]